MRDVRRDPSRDGTVSTSIHVQWINEHIATNTIDAGGQTNESNLKIYDNNF